jgi:hypothetical protein
MVGFGVEILGNKRGRRREDERFPSSGLTLFKSSSIDSGVVTHNLE